MIRFTFAFAALLAMCATSNAAVRTFSTTAPSIVVSDANFELSSNWFSAATLDSTDPGEILDVAQITLAAPYSAIPLPAGVYDLSRVDYAAGTTYITFSQGGYNVNDIVFYMTDYPIPGPAYAGGADLPDGSGTASIFARQGTSTFDFSTPVGGGVTIGTAAVPEPSAFAFGGLALAVTGAGRWARRRFFA